MDSERCERKCRVSGPVQLTAPPSSSDTPGMASDSSWSKDIFSCPICLDVLNSSVTTPCGHNFCRTCITKFWDGQVQYKCPVCNKLFQTRPDLQVNNFISEMVDQFKSSVRVKEQPCVEPAEVPCDVCTGTQLKAVKSCLVFFTSYCQTHLEPHQRVAGLKRHRLVEAMDRLEDRMCKKHDRLLELFCKTEQVCVCLFCTETHHKFHPVVPLKEEYEVKTAQLGKTETEVQQMIQERKLKIKEIKVTVELSNKDADREIADGVQVFTALKRYIEKWQDEFNQTVKERLKSTEKEVEDLIKELEQEIEDLTNRSSEVKQPPLPLQVLCREALTGRCYWEVEREGGVEIGVTYRGITRRGGGDDSRLGGNNKSWILYCNDGGYSSWYNDSETDIDLPPAGSNRVGVYLDRPAGTLSFYRVSPDVGGSSDTLTHIHTFQSTFTQEDLHPGYMLYGGGASVSLCRL